MHLTLLAGSGRTMMAIKHFTFASLLLFVSFQCAVARHDLKPRSMTQLANLPETIREKRGEHESIAYLGKQPNSIVRASHTVQKREIQQPKHQLQKRFVVLPPIETDNGLRFDVSREDATDGIVFLKRSPSPYATLVTAATSFANSFSQARNNRKQTVVLNSDPDGNITGARTINSGGPRKLININFVSHRQPQPQHQHQHQMY